MQNKFGKSCAKCGIYVHEYKGVCEKSNGKWKVYHVNCISPQRAQELENEPIFRPWTEADWERVAGEPVPRPNSTTYTSPSSHFYLTNSLDNDLCYELYGMSDADFRSAVNPDEGDR